MTPPRDTRLPSGAKPHPETTWASPQQGRRGASTRPWTGTTPRTRNSAGPYSGAQVGARHRRGRRGRFRRRRDECAGGDQSLDTLMRHLFPKGSQKLPNAAGMPPDALRVSPGAAGMPPDALRVSRSLLPSSGTADLLHAQTGGEPPSSTPWSSSDDLDRRTSRSPLSARRACTRRIGNPPRSSFRDLEYWTSVPLSGDTIHLWHYAAGGKAQGDRQVFCPWAFGLPGSPIPIRLEQLGQMGLQSRWPPPGVRSLRGT